MGMHQNAALRAVVDPKGGVVVGTPTLAFGAVLPHAARAHKTENFLSGMRSGVVEA